MLVEVGRRVGRAVETGQDAGVHRLVAGAAIGGDDRVGVAQDIEIAGDAGVFQRQSGGIGAEPLPGFHLALVGALGDLLVEIERHHRMDGKRRNEVAIDHRLGILGLGHRLPVGVEAFAETRGQADAGDPDLARHRRIIHAFAGDFTGMSARR